MACGIGAYGQAYIPAGLEITASDRSLITHAGSDTAGYLYLAGNFSGRLEFMGQSVQASGKQSVFWCRLDPSGQPGPLLVIGGSGYSEVQAAAFLPDGASLLVLYYRDTLVCGDSVFIASGRGGVTLVRLNRSGEITGVTGIMNYFQGQIHAVAVDTAGTVWLGGWYRKMKMAGRTYRSRGKSDALLIPLREGVKMDSLFRDGEGKEDIRFLDIRDGHLLVSGVFDHTLPAGDTLLQTGRKKGVYLAIFDDEMRTVKTGLLAVATDLSLTAFLRTPEGTLYLAGWFSGILQAQDTSLLSAGCRDGFVLAPRTGGRVSLLRLGGMSDDAVTALAATDDGRHFLTASFKQRMILERDTFIAEDRYADLLFARFDTSLSLLWGRQVSGGNEENITVMSVTSDRSVWLGGHMYDRLCVRGSEDFPDKEGEEGSYLLKFIDPCSLLHFDLPAEKTICYGVTDTLDAGDGYENYLWMPGNYPGRKLPVKDTGLYVVEITGRYGCRARDTVRVRADSVSMAFVVTEETLPEGNNGAVDMSLLSGKPPFRIYWNTGQITEDLDHLQAGTYRVTVTDSLGCSASGEVEVTLRDLTAVYDLYNYPNPFDDLTRVVYSLPEGTEVMISIYDLSGRKLFVLREQSSPKGVHAFEWSREHLKDGVYYLRMQSRFGQLSRKIIILKKR